VSTLAKAVRESAARNAATHGDDCVAVLELLAAAKEGLYVRLLKRLHFAYRRDGLPHDTTNTAAMQHRCVVLVHTVLAQKYNVTGG
jgi:selenophosphate synthetase-related protein